MYTFSIFSGRFRSLSKWGQVAWFNAYALFNNYLFQYDRYQFTFLSHV